MYRRASVINPKLTDWKDWRRWILEASTGTQIWISYDQTGRITNLCIKVLFFNLIWILTTVSLDEIECLQICFCFMYR